MGSKGKILITDEGQYDLSTILWDDNRFSEHLIRGNPIDLDQALDISRFMREQIDKMEFGTITLPLILPGLITGAVLAFAKAMGEFGATITFVSNIPGQTQTLPSAIYTFLQIPGGEASALRLVAVSVGVAMTALLASEFLARRAARRVAGG